MNSVELQNLLTQRLNIIHAFYAECEKDPAISIEVDIKALSEAMTYAETLKHECISDIQNNIVPTSFYAHLQHDIEQGFPAEIPTALAPHQSNLFLYKAIAEQIIEIKELHNTYTFYKALGFAQKNTVLVGANGCGKTSLANFLKKKLDIRDGIVIPAQKLLILPKFINTPNLDNVKLYFEQYQNDILDDKITFNAKEISDFEYSLSKRYGSEMVSVLGYLLGECQAFINRGARKIKKGHKVAAGDIRCTLDDVMDIWNELIEHRLLDCNENNSLKILYENSSYDAHEMSDGERVIIYHAGRVLLAPHNSLIIVDEPEVHLHKSIANKLWDKLETRRKDCTFIYFTHDLDFASSRIAQKGWIKDFKYPNRWKIELLEENDIPEELQLKLVGSRKKILFCEGNTQNSIDRCIFEILFPEYTIQPLESCKAVITYTQTFNALKNLPTTAYGLIDRDFRNKQQLDKLKNEAIYSYSVAEIENLFLVEDFIVKFAQYKNEVINIDDIKSNVIQSIENDLENQLAAYITSAINFIFKESHVQRADTKEKVINNFTSFINNINIDDLYIKQKQKIEGLISARNYDELIKIINNKGLLSKVSLAFKYKTKNDYIEKALYYLKEEKEAQLILRKYFPQELL